MAVPKFEILYHCPELFNMKVPSFGMLFPDVQYGDYSLLLSLYCLPNYNTHIRLKERENKVTIAELSIDKDFEIYFFKSSVFYWMDWKRNEKNRHETCMDAIVFAHTVQSIIYSEMLKGSKVVREFDG